MKIKLTKYDKMWSKLVRERDNDTCQVCGNVGHTNAHHIESRSIKSLRFELANGISLCAGCHTFNHKFSAHKTPEAFKRWFKKNHSLRWEVIKVLKRQYMSEREAVEKFIEHNSPADSDGIKFRILKPGETVIFYLDGSSEIVNQSQ